MWRDPARSTLGRALGWSSIRIRTGGRRVVSTRPGLAVAALGIYPNPSGQGKPSTLRLTGPAVLAGYQVLDLLGRPVATGTGPGADASLPTHLPAGLYLVRAQTTQGQTLTTRWRVE